MYFLLFYFFVLILGNFVGLRFRVFGVLGSYGLRVFVLEVFVFETPQINNNILSANPLL